MAKLTDHEKAKRAKARLAKRQQEYRLREFEKHYQQLVGAINLVGKWGDEISATLPAVERKVLARLAPIQKMIDADRAAKSAQQEKEERVAWKKDHPGRTLRDLDASLHANDQDAWMEWDMWRLRHDDPEYYAKLDAEKAETAA